jgi:hypothetical protein
MKKIMNILYLLLITLSLLNCSKQIPEIKSPDESIHLSFQLKDGSPNYFLLKDGNTIIDTSLLGFEFKSAPAMKNNFTINNIEHNSFNEVWKPLWGENKNILNEYNELVVELVQNDESKRKLNIYFKVYNDGVGIRYEFPEQPNLKEFVIMNELTQFKLNGDHKSWWIPGDHDSYEYKYTTSKISEIDISKTEYSERPDRFVSHPKSVNTPITMKTDSGLYLSFSEANLTDYADMTLIVTENLTLEADLVPWANGDRVRAETPFKSPWRTITIAEDINKLYNSNLILNLNEPSKIDDVSWIEPMKYIGIWWEMHIGKSQWAKVDIEGSWAGSGLPHGANTENTKRHIDFASEHGIKGVLVEGWNTGWEYWGADTTEFFDFVTPYDDFDFEEIVKYANERGVELVGHHETAGDVINYDKRVEEAFKFYKELGIRSVKTGYAGQIRPKGERHHGQFNVRHYRKVLKTAAKYGIMVNAHEPIKATGIRRTYPNMLTREGVRGMEFNAWSDGNPPEHTTIIPFTRGLAGPIDYTPGIFDLKFENYRQPNRVHTTLAKQLALYVVLYSPLNMAADLPENYEGKPAFEFIERVPVDWDETVILDGEIGDYATFIRRKENEWYLGSITDEQPRDKVFDLSFLESGITYTAKIFRDGDDIDYDKNPVSVAIEEIEVTNNSKLDIKLAKSGGVAIIFTQKN